MVKDAPSFGKIAAMVLFALTCFGLLLFLWLAFGGPVPLKPKGYRFHTSFAESGQLALEADVRISGVPVGKVKTDRAEQADRPRGRRDPAAVAVRAAAAGRARDPAPEDAAGRDLRGAHARATPARTRSPRAARSRPRRCPTRSSWTRSCARSIPRRARTSRSGCRRRRRPSATGAGSDLNDALGNLAPFAEDTATIVDVLNRQEEALSQLVANTGVVFGALSERDGQLRSLIENTDSVFAATAARDSELQAAFRALPTFEDESRKTFERLDEFQRETDPLITQLRPAARELSPTLEDLADLAPDLKNLLEELDPLIKASKAGFPAAEQVLEDTRPTLGQLVPATAQLTPAVDFIGLYKRELTSFFANAGSATQARDARTGLHYLRTSNPLNPENLAVYPNRLPTNRPNPYTLPGHFDQTATGLPVYEDRQCNAANLLPSIMNTPIDLVNTVVDAGAARRCPPVVPGLPLPPITLPPIPQIPLTPEQAAALIPTELLNQIQQYAFGVGRRRAWSRRRAASRGRSSSAASARSTRT